MLVWLLPAKVIIWRSASRSAPHRSANKAHIRYIGARVFGKRWRKYSCKMNEMYGTFEMIRQLYRSFVGDWHFICLYSTLGFAGGVTRSMGENYTPRTFAMLTIVDNIANHEWNVRIYTHNTIEAEEFDCLFERTQELLEWQKCFCEIPNSEAECVNLLSLWCVLNQPGNFSIVWWLEFRVF